MEDNNGKEINAQDSLILKHAFFLATILESAYQSYSPGFRSCGLSFRGSIHLAPYFFASS